MSRSQPEPTEPAAFKPAIQCLPLPAFDGGDLDAVRAAFAAAAPCPLGQAWRAALEPGFAPGHVRTG